jgi:hypothetical protein
LLPFHFPLLMPELPLTVCIQARQRLLHFAIRCHAHDFRQNN